MMAEPKAGAKDSVTPTEKRRVMKAQRTRRYRERFPVFIPVRDYQPVFYAAGSPISSPQKNQTMGDSSVWGLVGGVLVLALAVALGIWMASKVA